MSGPLTLSTDESLFFTYSGTYFRTSDLVYVGTFNLGTGIQSVSHSVSAQEAVVLQSLNGSPYYPYGYSEPTQFPAAFKRFTGPLLFPAPDVPMPLVGGMQSYGISIFHDATDRHVMLVQTGTSEVNGAGALYFLVVR